MRRGEVIRGRFGVVGDPAGPSSRRLGVLMGTIEARKFTYEDLRTMPQNGKRYELIGGEVYVTPSPNPKATVTF